MSNIDKTLLSGSMGTMLLKLLSEKDMYGYEMIETLRSASAWLAAISAMQASSRTPGSFSNRLRPLGTGANP